MNKDPSSTCCEDLQLRIELPKAKSLSGKTTGSPQTSAKCTSHIGQSALVAIPTLWLCTSAHTQHLYDKHAMLPCMKQVHEHCKLTIASQLIHNLAQAPCLLCRTRFGCAAYESTPDCSYIVSKASQSLLLEHMCLHRKAQQAVACMTCLHNPAISVTVPCLQS